MGLGYLATHGEVFAGEETAHRIRDDFALRDRGAHHLKNVGKSVRVYQVGLDR
jgi:class 3 adenylate cyclase